MDGHYYGFLGVGVVLLALRGGGGLLLHLDGVLFGCLGLLVGLFVQQRHRRLVQVQLGSGAGCRFGFSHFNSLSAVTEKKSIKVKILVQLNPQKTASFKLNKDNFFQQGIKQKKNAWRWRQEQFRCSFLFQPQTILSLFFGGKFNTHKEGKKREDGRTRKWFIH